MDTLSDILETTRFSGTIFSEAVLSSPWGVHTRGFVDRGIFHGVLQGSAWLTLDGARTSLQLHKGDVVLLPHGTPHSMADDPRTLLEPISARLRPSGRGLDLLRIDGGGLETRLVCGSVTFERSETHPLFGLLPEVIHLRGEDAGMVAWLDGTLGRIAMELESDHPGSSLVMTRLAETLVVEAIRDAIRNNRMGPGWLSGLGDPQIGRALAMIHQRPHHPWSADGLASQVAMSRTAFYDRFRELVGEPPSRYVTRWRMHVAAGLLEDKASVAEVAEAVGYSSESSFSRAFKRVVGRPPTHYRELARGT